MARMCADKTQGEFTAKKMRLPVFLSRSLRSFAVNQMGVNHSDDDAVAVRPGRAAPGREITPMA
jgi:hypothetical protein